VAQNFWCLGQSVPFDNVAAAYAACHHFKQNFIFANVGYGHFLDADIMVVIVDGGKHKFHQKRKFGLGFACLYLVEEVVGFFWSVVVVDDGADGSDCRNGVLSLPNVST
jgi:hypothetical protein